MEDFFRQSWILFLIPVLLSAALVARRRQPSPALRFPSGMLVRMLPKTWKTRLHPLPFYLRLMVLALFVTALAGPRQPLEETEHQTEGIDIILAVDASGSMRAEDFTLNGQRYNRLAVVKQVVSEFIDSRPDDRLGLVAFAGEAYTVSPLTMDHAWGKANLERIDFDQFEDGTAIGSALATGLLRLKDSPAKSKVMVLLTDGINNRGKVRPLDAAEAAKSMGIKIYTIGAGTKGVAPFPVQDPWGRIFYRNIRNDIDEETLQQIAKITGGRYYRATDTDSLRRIYQEIDQLEKTAITTHGYRDYKEWFGLFLALGLGILGLEILLSQTLLLRLP